jgi:transcriptional regulator with XRE-family HTH domain
MDVEETLSQALRRVVRESPLAQGQIAKRAKMQPANLSRFMNGKMDLTTTTLDELCNVLGVTLAPVPLDPSAVGLGHGWIVQDRQQRAEATEERLKELEERLNARIDEVVALIKENGRGRIGG